MEENIRFLPTNMDIEKLYHLRQLVGSTDGEKVIVAVVYVYGSWNPKLENKNIASIIQTVYPEDSVFMVGSMQVDQTEETMAACLGDNECQIEQQIEEDFACPPPELPVLAISVQMPSKKHARIHYLTDFSPSQVLRYFKEASETKKNEIKSVLSSYLQSTISKLMTESWSGDAKSKRPRPVLSGSKDDAIRIFVAGDRSSVGKSSVCLGLLGNLVAKFGYDPSSLAYIKPATQCEAPQLVQKYCDSVGIECVPVGPLVYYKGFTRAFLAGETAQTSEDLLKECGESVDKIARGKKVVLVDGVGFPSVGSICGTDNASVSKACGYPHSSGARIPMGVVVVGGSGVGAAVDSFNLNATYFEMKKVPVMGAIFNKLSTEGFYSLENCRTQVTKYFDQDKHQRQLQRIAFGFVPQFPALGEDEPLNHIDEFFRVFADHVDIQTILDSAQRIKRDISPTSYSSMDVSSRTGNRTTSTEASSKRKPVDVWVKKENGNSMDGTKRAKLSRRDIEQLAAQQGASIA